MLILLYIVHVLICFFLIAVVLLQQGSGADLAVFGGGATQTAFGARGATNVLHKATVASFIAFMITTLAIGAIQVRQAGGGLLNDLPDAVEAEAGSLEEAAAAGVAEAEAAVDELEAEAAEEGVIAVDPVEEGAIGADPVETPEASNDG